MEAAHVVPTILFRGTREPYILKGMFCSRGKARYIYRSLSTRTRHGKMNRASYYGSPFDLMCMLQVNYNSRIKSPITFQSFLYSRMTTRTRSFSDIKYIRRLRPCQDLHNAEIFKSTQLFICMNSSKVSTGRESCTASLCSDFDACEYAHQDYPNLIPQSQNYRE